MTIPDFTYTKRFVELERIQFGVEQIITDELIAGNVEFVYDHLMQATRMQIRGKELGWCFSFGCKKSRKKEAKGK